MQGETSAARAAAGSAFGGLVRIREGDWGREVTVGVMRQLWVQRKKLSDKGTVTPLNQVFSQLAATEHGRAVAPRARGACAPPHTTSKRHYAGSAPRSRRCYLFLFAFQGALPPEVFTELHREANVVHRLLSAIAIEGAGGDEMLPMATVEERLPSVMPTKSEGARAEILEHPRRRLRRLSCRSPPSPPRAPSLRRRRRVGIASSSNGSSSMSCCR